MLSIFLISIIYEIIPKFAYISISNDNANKREVSKLYAESNKIWKMYYKKTYAEK